MIDKPPKPRLVSLVFRLRHSQLKALKRLVKKTRVRQSEYLREAVADLLKKRGQL